MKAGIKTLFPTLVALSATSLLCAADTTKSESKSASSSRSESKSSDKTSLRVISSTDREPHVRVLRPGKHDGEKETVAFLGVETGPVSGALSSQLGLQPGTGLVVSHVIPDSPAAAALKVHDILLKLDDQLLIETRQLSVLIRTKKEGDEVTLTYLRGGKQATAKVKLGKHEVPKFTMEYAPGVQAFAFATSPERLQMYLPPAEGDREETDRLLSLLQRAPGAGDGPPGFIPSAPRIRIERSGGPGVRAMSINTRNSNVVYSDDEGSLDLTIKEGVKTLVAKNRKGEEVFSGPVSTPEQRNAMPAELRARLEKLEGMQDVTFRTDGDFRGTEARIVRPRGIMLPLPPPSGDPRTAPLRRLPRVL